MRHGVLSASLALAGLLTGCGHLDGGPGAPRPPAEVRASWVVRTTITGDRAAERVVEEALRAGLNTLLVQVRGRGDAYFRSALEPRPPVLVGRDLDPLARVIRAARGRGVQVHAWVNANLVWSPDAPNPDRRHVVHAHPEWLLVPEELARELLSVPAGDPGFRARLETHARAHRGQVEGLYGDPAHPGYRRHVAAVVRDLAARYELDGVHLDYIRYPGPAWGFGRTSLDAFRAVLERSLGPRQRRDLARSLARDPLAATRRYPGRWASFRRRAVDLMVEGVARAARQARPGIVLSAAVFPDLDDARELRFQDWGGWLDRGWIDVVCPMNYTADRALFESRTRAVLSRGRVWVGIGAHRLDAEETAERVRLVRAAGGRGVVLFSHGSLRKKHEGFSILRRHAFP